MDEQANQIIITDYNDNLRAVGELIAALDTDKPEDVTVRVIPLKNMSAADLVKEIGPLYQKQNSKSPKDTVQVTADDQSNTLLILSSEANFRIIKQFVASLDTEEAQEKIMRTFTLKNADAQDVAKQLQDLNQAAKQCDGRDTSIITVPTSADKSAKKMSVVADRRRNAVIVQAPPAQMDGIEKMIEELDEPVSDDSLAPRIYPLKYVSATDIEDVLNELFLKKTQQRSYYDYYFGDDSGQLHARPRRGPALRQGPHHQRAVLQRHHRHLELQGKPRGRRGRPQSIGPAVGGGGKHAAHRLEICQGDDVANSINILFAKNGSPPLRAAAPAKSAEQSQSAAANSSKRKTPRRKPVLISGTETKEDGYFPWLGGQPDNPRSSDTHAVQPVSDLIGRVRAVADERSNALLISANVHFFPQILKLIAELDAPTDQVLDRGAARGGVERFSGQARRPLVAGWQPDVHGG